MATFIRNFLFGVFAMTLALSAGAVTISPNETSTTLTAGTTKTYSVSNVSGSLSVTSSNTTVATITKLTSTSYRVNARNPGAANIRFADRKGSITVAVTVNAAATSSVEGRLLASNCFQCHGTNGSGGFDKLAGSTEADIYDHLRKFALGLDEPSGIMAAHAMGYSDAQLRSIAKYLSTLR